MSPRRLFCGAALIGALWSCGGKELPPDARTTVLSLRNLDCAECAAALVVALKKEAGVYDAGFDRRKSELSVVAAPSTDALALAKDLGDGEEYEIVLGAGKGSYLPWKGKPANADVVEVNQDGADVPSLEAILVAGKVTVVDFSAKWCEPCRKLDEHLLGVVSARSDVAYRKLDVGDWDTPLAERYLKGVRELPYVIVYDKERGKVAAITGLNLAAVDAAITKGAGP